MIDWLDFYRFASIGGGSSQIEPKCIHYVTRLHGAVQSLNSNTSTEVEIARVLRAHGECGRTSAVQESLLSEGRLSSLDGGLCELTPCLLFAFFICRLFFLYRSRPWRTPT